MSRKPSGYWDDENNVIKEAQKAINEIGYVPKGTKELRTGYKSLEAAIRRHGGMEKMLLKLGYKYTPNRLPKNYWRDKEIVKKEITTIIDKLGNFPSESDIRRAGLDGMLASVHQYHGGILKLRREMGYDLPGHISGYWKDIKNMEKEARKIIKKYGCIPGSKELQKNHGGFLNAIHTYYGSLGEIREKFGFKQETHPHGYWKKRENVEKEMESLIKKLGHFPTQKEIYENNLGGLSAGISLHHDGLTKFKESMGYSNSTKDTGYWKVFENVKTEINGIIEEMGYFPGETELKKTGHSSLAVAVYKYHGGFRVLRESMGFDQKRRPDGYLKKWENMESEIRKITNKLGHFPTYKELKSYDPGVASAMKFHGGFYRLRENFGYTNTKKPMKYWHNLENVKRELGKVIKDLKHFPSHGELVDIGSGSLATAIQHHGGYIKLREMMGFDQVVHPVGYWKDWGNIKKELGPVLDEFYSEYGRLPKYDELRRVSKLGLVGGIDKYGGIVKVYERLGYLPLNSAEGFINFVENNKVAKVIVEKLGDDHGTMRDVFHLVYEDTIDKEKLSKLLNKDSVLSNWLGKADYGIRSPKDIVKLGKVLLPFDKNNKIKKILQNRAFQFRREQLGTMPPMESREKFREELTKELYKLNN